MHAYTHIGVSFEDITDQIYILFNTPITTTNTPISLNAQSGSSNTRWIITGAVVGSILALGAMFTITAIVTALPKERDTQGLELTTNKECSETADCASIQLGQNVAYQRWRGKYDNVKGTTM